MTTDTQQCGRCKQFKSLDDYSPSYRGRRGTWCRSCFAAYNRGDPSPVIKHAPRECEECGRSYVPRQLKDHAAYCSRECKVAARNARIAAETLAAKEANPRYCLYCSRLLPATKHRHAIFCTARCNEKAHALQRKLRMRTGQDGKPGYLRAEICERDGWRCQLCSKFVDRYAEHPDPLCASIDHIIAVSAGGDNNLSNLQLVHLVCNLRRRNLPIEIALSVLKERELVKA